MSDELPQYNPFNFVVCADCRHYCHPGDWQSKINFCCHPDRARVERRHPITGEPAFVERNDPDEVLFCWPSPDCELHNSRGDCDKFERRLPEHASDPTPWAKQCYDQWMRDEIAKARGKSRRQSNQTPVAKPESTSPSSSSSEPPAPPSPR